MWIKCKHTTMFILFEIETDFSLAVSVTIDEFYITSVNKKSRNFSCKIFAVEKYKFEI